MRYFVLTFFCTLCALFAFSIYDYTHPDAPVTHKGFVVAKEYAPGGMCHSRPAVRQEASLLGYVHVATTTTHHHKYEPSTFTVYVANRYETEPVAVDSLRYDEVRCGQRFAWTN